VKYSVAGVLWSGVTLYFVFAGRRQGGADAPV
jgi:hypothetical protein